MKNKRLRTKARDAIRQLKTLRIKTDKDEKARVHATNTILSLVAEVEDAEVDSRRHKKEASVENKRACARREELDRLNVVASQRYVKMNDLRREVRRLKGERLGLGYGMTPNRARQVLGLPMLGDLDHVPGISANDARLCSLTEWRERQPANVSLDEWVFHYLTANGEPSSVSDILDRQGAIVLTREQFDGLRAMARSDEGVVTLGAHLSTESGTIGGFPFVVRDRQGTTYLTREQFDGLRAEAERNTGRVEVAHLKTANSGTIGGRSYVIVDNVLKRKAQRRRPHLNENRKRSEYEGGRRKGSRRKIVGGERRQGVEYFPYNQLERQSIGFKLNAPELTEGRLRRIAANATEGRREGERREGHFRLGRRFDSNGDCSIGRRTKFRRCKQGKNERRGEAWSRRNVVRRVATADFYTDPDRRRSSWVGDRRASS